MSPKAKNYLILLLAFSTATGGAIAWQQSKRLTALEQTLLNARPVDVAHTPHVTAHPGEAGTTAAPTETAATTEEPPAPPAGEGPPPARRGNNMAALLANPEFAKAWSLQQRAALDGRFAGLFKKLNLSPIELENLKNLLVERQSAAMDVMAAARENGINGRENRDELRKLTAQAQAEVDQSIRAALGDTRYAEYQNYEATQSQRNVVSQLDQRLSYSATPLTTAQSEFLVSALASTSTSGNQNNTAGWPGGGGNRTAISDAVITQAQTVLNPTQVEALQQLQAEQKAQQQLGQLMRNNGGGGNRQRTNN